MVPFDKIIVTDIEEILTVHSQRGKHHEIIERRFYGLSLCISGQITYSINGQTIVSGPNHAVFLPKGASYTLHGDKTGLFPLINFQCKDFDCDTILALPLQHPETCIKDYEAINNLFLFPENRFRVYSTFYELLHKIFSEQLPEHNPLFPVISYIEANLADSDLSNTALAEHINVSEGYLRKLFFTKYKTTPRQFILDFRIRKAKQLLLDTSLSITEIADACGFSSLCHFSKAFKERTGTSPTQYASQYRIYKI